jgi:hypothetical protein
MAGAVREVGVQMNRFPALFFSGFALTIALGVFSALTAVDRGLFPAYEWFALAAGLLGSVLTVVMYLTVVPRARSSEEMSATAMWQVAVTVVVFSYGLPLLFVVLATSGWSISAVLPFIPRPHLPGGRWLGVLEDLSVLGIPLLVVALPEYLKARGRAAAANVSSLVPGWLAGFASALTATYILLLHFGGFAEPDLRKAHIGVLSVAAFGVAVLLAPFYRVVAKECLQHGIAVVFDPAGWWSAWCDAYGEMRGAPAVAAEALRDSTGALGGGQGTGGSGDDPEVSAGAR